MVEVVHRGSAVATAIAMQLAMYVAVTRGIPTRTTVVTRQVMACGMWSRGKRARNIAFLSRFGPASATILNSFFLPLHTVTRLFLGLFTNHSVKKKPKKARLASEM